MINESQTSVPRVSVLLATIKEDQWFAEAVDSILAQTFQNFEFILVIDATAVDLISKVQASWGHDPRLRIICAEMGGFAFALNLGICAARGEFIARMDGDDVSKPNRLEKQVEFLDKNPDIGVVGCRIELIDSDSKLVGRALRFFESDTQIRKALPYRNPLIHPALMFRKATLVQVKGYQYGHTSEDHEMFLRMARNPSNKFHNLDMILFQYRRHEAQATAPWRISVSFSEISGFLFTEFLMNPSPKYLLGMVIIHPWVRRFRLFLRRWIKGSDL